MGFYPCENVLETCLTSLGENNFALRVDSVDGSEDSFTGRLLAFVGNQGLFAGVGQNGKVEALFSGVSLVGLYRSRVDCQYRSVVGLELRPIVL